MVFGMGGGTSSYQEGEETDLILLWGSNARETHPIFFHHLLRGLRNGARMYAVDPRRTSSVQWAELWAALDVGSDIALANAIGREIIAAGLEHREFIENATTGFDDYRRGVEPYTLAYAERETGVPVATIRTMAHEYARARRAMICWTLGITEHHNAVDNVLALVNLSLLTGHVGRYGSGLNPLRGQNNVQGGGDMGALPDRLPGFQHVENDELRSKFDRAWGTPVPPERGWHLSQMFEAMARGELRTLYVIGENPLQSEATVTSSERRVQRVRKAIEAPAGARGDLEILYELARRMGRDWGRPDAETIWNEVRRLSPMNAGMSYARLEKHGGLQWPCYDEEHPGEMFLHSRLWERPIRGPRVSFVPVEHDPPVDRLDAEFPLRLTTGRRLEEYNTGVQTSGYHSPLRRGESLDVSPEDADRYGLRDGEVVRVRSRRGAVEVPIRRDEGLRSGLTFMTLHFPDDVATNLLTIDATDPKSGTAEFKATAIRIERLEV